MCRGEMEGNVAREERKRCGTVDAPLWHATALTNQATRFSGDEASTPRILNGSYIFMS